LLCESGAVTSRRRRQRQLDDAGGRRIVASQQVVADPFDLLFLILVNRLPGPDDAASTPCAVVGGR
jgi:hypothetical protein